jgi:hypothetical protein
VVVAAVCIVCLWVLLGPGRRAAGSKPGRPAPRPSLHRRRCLADAVELALDHRAAMRRGLVHTPAIPAANRAAVEAPLRASIAILRDRSVVIEASLERLGALAVDPRSALYQPYPNRARCAAEAAHDELAAASRPATTTPAPPTRSRRPSVRR